MWRIWLNPTLDWDLAIRKFFVFWRISMQLYLVKGHCSGYVGNLIYSEEKIRQTLRKSPLLCSLRWRPVVDSKDIDGYICVLVEEDMLFLKRMVIKEIDPEGVELRRARRLRICHNATTRWDPG